MKPLQIISVCLCTFVLGLTYNALIMGTSKTDTRPPTTNDMSWFDALPDPLPGEQQDPQPAAQIPQVQPEKKDLRETQLRAYYLNKMREQQIRHNQQILNFELESRRQNRLDKYPYSEFGYWGVDGNFYCPHGRMLTRQCNNCP